MKVSDGRKKPVQPSAPPELEALNGPQLAKAIRGRLLAQEYLSNGANMHKAAEKVLGTKPGREHRTIKDVVGGRTSAFTQELERLLQRVDIDKDQALRTLWAMVNVSLIDFVDDNGNLLPIKNIRALPRVAQQIISEMTVTRSYKPVRGADGEYLYDPNTHQPILKPEVSLKLKLPEKIKAIQTIASILKWVEGTKITVNIAQVMKQADEQQKTITTSYAPLTAPTDERGTGEGEGDA